MMQPGTHLQQLIKTPDENGDYLIFKADTIPPKDSLVFYIQDEFADFGVLTDCKLGAYSAAEKKYVYEEFIPAPASRYAAVKPPIKELPVLPTPTIISCYTFRTGMNISSSRWTSGSSVPSCCSLR
jgi:hypothetical protein